MDSDWITRIYRPTGRTILVQNRDMALLEPAVKVMMTLNCQLMHYYPELNMMFLQPIYILYEASSTLYFNLFPENLHRLKLNQNVK